MADRRAITGSMLHDLVACPRRVHHDLHTDRSRRDPVSAFVQMLWTGGREHEADMISRLGGVTDLREVGTVDREAATKVALAGAADVILGALIRDRDRIGMPDLLRRVDGVWTAGDIKSGSALEPDGRRPRLEYAVQVAHYASILAANRLGAADWAFVVGRDGAAVPYNLAARHDRQGQSLMDITAGLTAKARMIVAREHEPLGAMSAVCKLCHWHTVCDAELIAADDPTLIAGVGRRIRDAMRAIAPSVRALAELDLGAITGPDGRSSIPGLGAGRLERFQHRARLILTPGARAYARKPLGLRRHARELHFDIETDPSRGGLVYLHGILDRRAGQFGPEGEYVHFFADGEHGERDAFARTLDFLTADPAAMIYYYSKFERTSFRALQARHPSVCSEADVELLFPPERAVDLLFDVIMPSTEWPTRNLSIKTLARHLGFDWRDHDASGASSIAWFDDYVRTGDEAIRQRIVNYNADDVRASAVVLDGLIALPVREPPTWPPSPEG